MSRDALVVPLRFHPLLLVLLIATHLLPLAVCVSSSLDATLKAAFGFAVVTSFCHHLWRDVLKRANDSLLLLVWQRPRWFGVTRAGRELPLVMVSPPVVTAPLVALGFRARNRAFYPVAILSGGDAVRQLRVMLRWGYP